MINSGMGIGLNLKRWRQAFGLTFKIQVKIAHMLCLIPGPDSWFQLPASVDPRRQQVMNQEIGSLSPTWVMGIEFLVLSPALVTEGFGEVNQQKGVFLSLPFLSLSLSASENRIHEIAWHFWARDTFVSRVDILP